MICCIDCVCDTWPQSADVVPFDDMGTSLVLAVALLVLLVVRMRNRRVSGNEIG